MENHKKQEINTLAITNLGTAPTEPTLITSYTQISQSVIISSGTADAVDWAGRKTALAYQLAKESKAIKRDMEAMLVGNTGNSAGKGHTAPMCGNVH
jgi:hypothetical protein